MTQSAVQPISDEPELPPGGPDRPSEWVLAFMEEIERINNRVKRRQGALAEKYGLRAGDFATLYVLARATPDCTMRPSELAQKQNVTSGGITKRLQALEAANLIERLPDPLDGRVMMVRIKPEGLATTRNFRAAANLLPFGEIGRSLSEAEWSGLLATLQKLEPLI